MHDGLLARGMGTNGNATLRIARRAKSPEDHTCKGSPASQFVKRAQGNPQEQKEKNKARGKAPKPQGQQLVPKARGSGASMENCSRRRRAEQASANRAEVPGGSAGSWAKDQEEIL